MNNTLNFDVRQTLLFEKNAFDGIICIPYILFGYLVISRVKIIDRVFEELGKYSGAIFVSHIFSKPLLSKIHLFFQVSCTDFCNAFRLKNNIRGLL